MTFKSDLCNSRALRGAPLDPRRVSPPPRMLRVTRGRHERVFFFTLLRWARAQGLTPRAHAPPRSGRSRPTRAVKPAVRCRANMAHVRQSWPEYGLVFKAKVLKAFQVVAFSLQGRGSSRFESLILPHHARFTCECNKKDINDDGDDAGTCDWSGRGSPRSGPSRPTRAANSPSP